jgi:hypothetical protein
VFFQAPASYTSKYRVKFPGGQSVSAYKHKN